MIKKTHLTDAQFVILKTLLDNQDFDGVSPKGLTSYVLRKYGVAGRTFDINKKFLLDSIMIYVVKKEKAGKQIRIFYDITPFGFLAMLKKDQKRSLEQISGLSRFIPILSKNWKSLEKQCGNLMYNVLEKTLRDNNEIFQIFLDEKGNVIDLPPLTTINIPTRNSFLQISYTDFLWKRETSSGRSVVMSPISSDNYKFGKNVLESFVLLYFLNMYFLFIDKAYISQVYNEEFPQSAAGISLLNKRNDDNWNKLKKKQEKISPLILKIIKNDMKLSGNIQFLITGIFEKIKKSGLDILQKNLLD